MKQMLRLGSPPYQKRHGSYSALDLAARSGNSVTIKLLLDFSGPVVEDRSQRLNSALVWAASGLAPENASRDANTKHRKILAEFLHRGADVNVVDSYHRSPVSFSAYAEDLIATEMLLKAGAAVNISDNGGKTPLLHVPSTDDGGEIVRMLVKKGADINHVDNKGYTALLWHSYLSNTQTCKILLAEGADPLLTRRDGMTALQMASNYCMAEMMRDLLDAGADVEACDDPHRTPLLLASKCHMGRADALKILLERGANPNVTDKTGQTPLHFVCGQYSTCLTNTHDFTDQLIAAKALIEHGANVNATYTKPRMLEHGITSIGLAASDRVDESIKYQLLKALLDAGAHPDGLGRKGLPAVALACKPDFRADSESHDGGVVDLLLDAGANVNFRGKRGRTLLHYAAKNRSCLSLVSLLKRDIQVDAMDNLGMTALHLACSNSGWMTMEQYKKCDDAGRYETSTPYANWHSSIASTLVLYALHAGGANPYAQDNHGRTPMHMAAKAGNPRIMATLLLQTGQGLLYDSPDFNERLPFHYAANSPEVTHMLLNYHLHNGIEAQMYFDVKEPDINTIRQLTNEITEGLMRKLHNHRYARDNPTELVDEDIRPLPWLRGKCSSKDTFGNTSLHYASLAGNVDVVKQYLHVPNIDLSVINNDGETALNFASAHRECAIAIYKKMSELGDDIPEDERFAEAQPNPSRVEAEQFVAALKESNWKWFHS
jgi:ankyrin repeat protein